MEKQLLPNAELKPAYDKAAWLYVYRDFSKSEMDLTAERISLRMGVTSWPQLILVDPAGLRVLGSTGRTVDSFLRAVNRIELRPTNGTEPISRVKDADERAMQLEKNPNVELATQRLMDDDIVVRFRALEVLAAKDPASVAKNAVDLLSVPNDSFRLQVCAVLTKNGHTDAKSALEKLVKSPADSNNPNVLRIRAVQALGASGDASSIAVIEPFAKGSYLNSLTGTSVDALVSISKRHPDSKPSVRKTLISAFPALPSQPNATHVRFCTALAKRVHRSLIAVTAQSLPFPDTYDLQSRRELIQAWQEASDNGT